MRYEKNPAHREAHGKNNRRSPESPSPAYARAAPVLSTGSLRAGDFKAPLCPNYNVFAMTGPRKLPASLSPCLQAPVQAQPGAMGGSDGDPPEERQGASTKEPAPRARRKRGSRTRRP